MLLIKNNDDTPVTIKTYDVIDAARTNYYLKFTDSTKTNSVILELPNLSAQPKYYNRFLILENSGIPTGRGEMRFYISETAGLTVLDEADFVSEQEYQLEVLSTFEIVQYYPEKIDYIYYKQL